MLSPEFLAMLRCPEDRTPLVLGDAELVARLNAAVSAGRLRNRAGQAVERQLDGALVRQDGQVIYPIIDQIPVLLVDEAILRDEL